MAHRGNGTRFTFARPHWLVSYGIGNTMLIMTGMTFVGLLICIALAPETRGLPRTEASSVAGGEVAVARAAA